jgi:ankyrin repeat protein
MNEIRDYICPITQMVFRDPVLAPDGHFYERLALTRWLKNSNKSPLTGLVIDKIMISCVLFNNMLKDYLIAHPDKLSDQFVEQSVEEFNAEVFCRLFKSNNIDELITYMSLYNTFSLQASNYMAELLKNLQIVKILIDKNVNIIGKTNKKLIHWICQYSIPEIIRYIIDKGVDLECQDNGGWRPIHFICRYSTPDMIKYIIDKGVDLACQTNDGWRPIHFICRYSTPEMIKYIIDKGVDLDCSQDNGWKPIHFICRHSTPEIIKYIIDKGVELECRNNDGWRPIHLICTYSTPEMIKYIINKGVDLECQTNTGWKPIHLICQYSTPDMVKYIIEKGVDVSSCVSFYDGYNCNYSVHDIINIRFGNCKIVNGFIKQDFIQHLIY